MYNELDASQSLSEFQNNDSQSSMDSSQSSQYFARFPLPAKTQEITEHPSLSSKMCIECEKDQHMEDAMDLIPDTEPSCVPPTVVVLDSDADGEEGSASYDLSGSPPILRTTGSNIASVANSSQCITQSNS